jgi:NADH-quinone oxidoreductase subunit C
MNNPAMNNVSKLSQLKDLLTARYAAWIVQTTLALGELTVTVKPEHLLELCYKLRDETEFNFKLLIDVCGVDYLHYGLDDWQTQSATESGFSRGVTSTWIPCHPERSEGSRATGRSLAALGMTKDSRFAVVYHLLSLNNNQRLRLRVNIPNEAELMVDSVMPVWPAANWFEREAFDLFGIAFKDHPDLRRILTDYGFAGHPFRKDFPLIGKVEVRYDAASKRVVYEPVSIEPRVLGPKVIRQDNRYKEQ